MDRLVAVWEWVRSLVRRRAVDEELELEIRHHLDRETERNRSLGMDPLEARRRALLAFGGVDRFTERAREARGTRWTLDAVSDVRSSLRVLAQRRGFTALASLTLATGIAAVTTLFSVVNAVLLEPLPFEEPDRLAIVWTRNQDQGQDRYFTSPRDLSDWREQTTSFTSIGGFWETPRTITEPDGEPLRARAAMVTWDFLSTLGVQPLVGRVFDQEDGPGAPVRVLIGEALWRSRYGADPALIGRAIQLDGDPATIVGVVPAAQTFPEGTELWYNVNFPLQVQSRSARWLTAVGRLAPGATLDRAGTELAAIAQGLADQFADTNAGWSTRVESLSDRVVGDTRPALLILMGASLLTLLIACANVANLLLARAETREAEMALRTAFGASRARLVRYLLVESLVLSGLGGTIGVAVSFAAVALLPAAAPDVLPGLAQVTVEGRVLAFAVAVAVGAGVLFGLAPVGHLVRGAGGLGAGGLGQGLRVGGLRGSSRSGRPAQSVFVVAQFALALAVVAGSGLLIRSFVNLRSADPGFERAGLLAFEIELPQARYVSEDGSFQEVRSFYPRLDAELSALPGVREVTFGTSLPLGTDRDFFTDYYVADLVGATDETPRAFHRPVDADYFEVMGIPVVEGRGFDSSDRLDSPGVAVVNRTLAERIWPEGGAVGSRLVDAQRNFGGLGLVVFDELEIVGVVEDVRYAGLRQATAPSIYFPHEQAPFRRMVVTVRADGDPLSAVPAIRRVVNRIDPLLPVSNARTLESVVARSLARDRFATALLTAFGLAALALSLVGIYGMLSFSVARRRREIGVRMAVGARQGRVVRMVVGHGARLALVGTAVGLGIVALVGRVIESQLYGVSRLDPAVLVGVTVLLLATAALASWLPALRAAGTDPVRSLRAE